MRLYLFRSTSDISIEGIERVANTIAQVFNIDFSIFSEPVNGTVEQLTMDELLRISDQFLERGEPIVALVFTREGVDDEAILGQASELHRGAWVKWTENLNQVTMTAIHKLGHICDADHCGFETCVMFHTYREHNGKSIDDLFCDRCKATIKSSWVYTRLQSSTQDRTKKKQVLPKIITSSSNRIPSPRTIAKRPSLPNNTPYDPRPPFPDWSLARTNPDEFIRQVMEHFGFRRR